MASLTIVNGANVGRSYELGDREMAIGRDPMCEIVVPVRTVSRQHARVGANAAGFYIEDLGSVNGTYINGKRLEGRALLENHDRVRISQNVFQFFDGGGDEQTVMIEAVAIKGESGSSKSNQETPEQDDDDDGSRMQHIVSTMDASASNVGGSVNPEEKLRAVLDIAQSLGSSLDLDDVLPKILESLFRIFPQTSHGYILQAPRVGAQLEPIAIKHRNSDSDTISPIGGPIVSRVMTEGAAFLSSPSGADDESVLDDAGPVSVMCAPLMGPSRTPLGVIHLDTNDAKRPFDQSDLEMLISVATVAGQSVEYARLHTDLLELDRQKRDLATAQDVQLHFLPQAPPEVEGYKFYDYYRAAATVAGDYYDYIRLPDGRLAIAMGDVAGKGVPAALLMARLCSDVRYTLLTHDTASAAVNALNKQLTGHLRPGRFITFVLFLLDPTNHTLSVVNAGHSPPLSRLSDRSIIKLAAEDKAEIPLGINDDVDYPQSDISLETGDVVLTYTDGINEASSPDGELYSNAQAQEILSTAPADVTHVGQAVVSHVRTFSGGQRQGDDICLLCFGRYE